MQYIANFHGCKNDNLQMKSLFYFHYENLSMQHTAFFHSSKNDNFLLRIFDYFHIFAQNIDCWYTLDSPR